MEDSNGNPLAFAAGLINLIGQGYESGLTADQVSTALGAVQQLVSQVGPSSQTRTGSQPGTAPRK